MLVEVMSFAPSDGGLSLAEIKTAFGSIALRWFGPPRAEPGEHFVEWTVDEPIAWGRNAQPVDGCGPAVRPEERRVVLRGRLDPAEDGVAVLALDGTLVLLDLACPLPADVADTWVELSLDPDEITLFPYEL